GDVVGDRAEERVLVPGCHALHRVTDRHRRCRRRLNVMHDLRQPVTLDDIRAAAVRLDGVALVTPLVPFTTPDGRSVLLKAESLQPVGAFKIRGAYNAIASLDFAVRSRGVVAASS